MITSEEYNPQDQQWYTYEHTFGATFELTQISTRGANEIYVLGQAPNGEDVVQQWILNEVLGARSARRSRAETPIGQPFSGSTVTEDLIVGGTFIINRYGTPFLSRFPLYRGSGLGLRSIAVDPDGRYVNLLGGSGANTMVYALGIFDQPPGAPTAIVNTSDLGVLADAWNLSVHNHSLYGRVIWIDQFNMEHLITGLAIDPDNDGVPTGFLEFDDEASYEEASDLDWGYHDWVPGW